MPPQKRKREFSVSPKVKQVTWREKKTRRGIVLAATPVSGQPLGTPMTQARRNSNYSRDQSLLPGEGIEAAMSLSPIPAPEFHAPKKAQSGKV